MRALVTSVPGGWSHTKVSEVNLREGSPDEVLVQITAVGLNPADNFLIEGQYPGGPKPPFIVGRDAAGVVIHGDANGKWQPGDPVVILQTSMTDLEHGTLCEQQWIRAENLARKPPEWSDAESAAAPLVFQTAWKALVDVGGLESGQQVIITGASGGVGLACVQLAKAYGATVVALSRLAEKQKRLLEIGAHFAFSPDEPHLKEKICEALQTKGVNLVVDTVGGPSLAMAVHMLGIYGRVSVVGLLAGVEGRIPIPALMFKRASIHGILVTDDPPAKVQSAWKGIVKLMNAAHYRPIIDECFPLESATKAFEKLRGNVFGKVVIEIG